MNDDDLLLAYLNDGERLAPNGGLDRSDSSLSNLSNASALSMESVASTVLFPHSVPRDVINIKAFCTMNGMVVRIRFPRAEDGWVYRYELGGHTQLRWDYQNTVILIARHNTCMKSIFPRKPCRNCFMKAVWRRECIDPDDIFYLMAVHERVHAAVALQTIVIETVDASDEEVRVYSGSTPKANLTRKRSLDEEAQRCSQTLSR